MASLAGVATTRKEYQRANRVLTCGGSRLVTSMETYVDGGRFVRPQLGDGQALHFMWRKWLRSASRSKTRFFRTITGATRRCPPYSGTLSWS